MRYLLITSCMLFLLTSCDKYKRQARYYEKHGDIYNSGTVNATLNNEPATFETVHTFLLDKVEKQVSINAYLSGYYSGFRPILHFEYVALSNGKQKIVPGLIKVSDSFFRQNDEIGSKAGFYLSGGDVSTDSYLLLDNYDSYINIDNYSPESSRLTGSFDVGLYYPYGLGRPKQSDIPDTLYFTGTFDLEIHYR